MFGSSAPRSPTRAGARQGKDNCSDPNDDDDPDTGDARDQVGKAFGISGGSVDRADFRDPDTLCASRRRFVTLHPPKLSAISFELATAPRPSALRGPTGRIREIKDDELYKEDGFGTWESYCRERWELGKRHANQLILSAEYRNKITVGASGAQSWSERSVRELTRIPDKRQAVRVAKAVVQAYADPTPHRRKRTPISKRAPTK